jgi:hypothetical protein
MLPPGNAQPRRNFAACLSIAGNFDAYPGDVANDDTALRPASQKDRVVASKLIQID